jgi:hypothetical protein
VIHDCILLSDVDKGCGRSDEQDRRGQPLGWGTRVAREGRRTAPEGRRAITDLAIAVLVNGISRVRVTVTGTVDGMIVSLVSDSSAGPDLPSSPAWLVVDSQRDQQSLWVEARWNTT